MMFGRGSVSKGGAESEQVLTEGSRVLLVDASEAGRLLGQGRSTILKLAARGEIPAVRIGRSVRFRVSDLEAFVKELPLD